MILQNFVSAGTIYNQGQPLANILDMHKLTVELDIAEKYVSDLHRGQKVTFQLASDSQTSYTSTIETIVPTIDPNQRTTIVRLKPVALPAESQPFRAGLRHGPNRGEPAHPEDSFHSPGFQP